MCFSFLFKGRCIYKESCSTIVLRYCHEKGFKMALRMMKHRFKNCKPGYSIFFNQSINEYNIITVNNEIIRQADLKEEILHTK